jgi:hypothetical protein
LNWVMPRGAKQSLDAVCMPDPLLDEGVPLTRDAPQVLLLGAGRHHHGTDPWLSPLPGQERAQQRLAIDRIGLGASLAPGDCHGRGINDVALDTPALEEPVHPKTFEARLLNADDSDTLSNLLFGPGLQPYQKVKQGVSIATPDRVPGHLRAARCQ